MKQKRQQRRTTESTELLRAMLCNNALECSRSNSKINTVCECVWVEETEKKMEWIAKKKMWRKEMRSQTEANAMDDFPFSIFCARILAHSFFKHFLLFLFAVLFFFARCQTDATSSVEFQKKINCQLFFSFISCW